MALVQLLATLDLEQGKVVRGIATYPCLGDKVFAASASLLKWVTTESAGTEASNNITLDLGWVSRERSVRVHATPERLFGRHCAVLGTTGGGESFTLARLAEQCAVHRCKIIVIDAVGEYQFDSNSAMRLALGRVDKPREGRSVTLVTMPHRFLTIADLFAIFQPSGKVQGPTLRRAIESQKLLALDESVRKYFERGGVMIKARKERKTFDDALESCATKMQSAYADFDVRFLAEQVIAECVYNDPGTFGRVDEAGVTYCMSLVNRIEGIIHAPELACVFKPSDHPSLTEKLTEFFAAECSQRILHLSLRDLAFDFNAREIVANAIARWLLRKAREDAFRSAQQPVIVFLDEAHHFLNKSLGDEDSRVQLDAFELIAKEGRKYWLTLCLATQQPRDIPPGGLSQNGNIDCTSVDQRP